MKYFMLFPFLGMWSISDNITSLLRGKSISSGLFRGNLLEICSLFLTTFIATLITEAINLSAHEWTYRYMPFENLYFLKIPVAVFIGWIPLVIGVIALINMIKHVNYLQQIKK